MKTVAYKSISPSLLPFLKIQPVKANGSGLQNTKQTHLLNKLQFLFLTFVLQYISLTPSRTSNG